MPTAPQSAPPKALPVPPRKASAPTPEPADPTSDALVNKTRVSLATGLPHPTIDGWVRAGKFPKPIKFGTHRNAPIRWRWRVIQEWIASYEASA